VISRHVEGEYRGNIRRFEGLRGYLTSKRDIKWLIPKPLISLQRSMRIWGGDGFAVFSLGLNKFPNFLMSQLKIKKIKQLFCYFIIF